MHRIITDAEKQAIIQLSTIERHQVTIAKKVGVSQYTVWKVLKGHREESKGFDVDRYVSELVTI